MLNKSNKKFGETLEVSIQVDRNEFFMQNTKLIKEKDEFTTDRVTNRKDIIQMVRYNIDENDSDGPDSLMIK